MKTLEEIIQTFETKVLQEENKASDMLNDNTIEVQYLTSLVELGL